MPRQLKAIEHRKHGNPLRRAHIDEDDSAEDVGRIGALARLVLQAIRRRLARHLDDRAVNVEHAAVIAAANALLGENAEFQRRVAVAAMQVQHADAPLQVLEDHQVLAERAHAQRHIAEFAA